MKTIKLDAHAKVNLSLDVIRRKENGYHELSMIMQEISLKDIMKIRETDKNTIEIKCNHPDVPTDSKNIAHKAATLMMGKYNKNIGLIIEIEKNIPIAAGLAGGSTDAAAVLKGLNEIWNLNLNMEQLMEIGLELGADIPFCIMGGTALAEGIGERLRPLKSFKDKHLLLVNPGNSISTAEVYKGLDIDNIKNRPDNKLLIQAIEEDDIKKLAANMKNVLESQTIPKCPIIEKIKEELISQGAIGSLMSGSGATVFGIFDSLTKLEVAKAQMEKEFKTTIAAITL